MEVIIREVWRSNFEQEMVSIMGIIHDYPCISFDSEFPGFLHNTPRYAEETDRYEDLKFNVNRLKPIQFGFAFSDFYGNLPPSGGVWQFNFSDFDPEEDLHVAASIDLLRQNGIDFERNKREGIEMKVFSNRFMSVIKSQGARIEWITFHGVYDIAYLLKILSYGKPMPESLQEFMLVVRLTFPTLYDLKFMAKFFLEFYGGELGLDRMAKILQVKRIGQHHQAGSDSLVIHGVFSAMKKMFYLNEYRYQGFLYGISFRSITTPVTFVPVLSVFIPIPVVVAPYRQFVTVPIPDMRMHCNLDVNPTSFLL